MPDSGTIYVYWIDNAARRDSPTGALRWSLPFADIREARAWGKGKVGDGQATLAVVVSYRDDPAGRVLRVYPEAARAVVEHYEQIRARAAQGAPGSN